VEPEVGAAIFAQDYDGFYDVMFTRDNPYDPIRRAAYRNIQLNYEKMRRVALAENYDAVWVVESDTIPPTDALRKLLQVDAPSVSGLYVLRHGSNIPNLMQFGVSPGIGSAMTWQSVKDALALGLTTIQTSGGCMGCVLLRRAVLERFEFITHPQCAPDVPLMQFCWQNQLIQAARLDVRCDHKEPNGTVLRVDDFLG
jgi:hypothetical protein